MTGWQCPGCGRCFAPCVSMCGYCGPQVVAGGTTNAETRCVCCGCIPCQGINTGCRPRHAITGVAI